MAEILWDKKVGTYDRVNSDYLTPEPHAHNIQIDLEIEVYLITYDWGNMGMIHGEVAEFTEPYYIGNLEGKITSANFSLDSTSDMRTTGSFSIILDENSKFITNASDSIFWQHVWFRVIKKYNYPNDINMYPMFNWGDHIGLWNNNGLYRSDPSQSIIGWFAPNSSSATFNADTREFSISCTDMMAFYTDTRGGHLSNWWESLSSPKYAFYDSIDHSDPNHIDPKFLEDKMDVATYSNGIFIEGQKNNQLIDLQYNNYFSELISKNVASDDKDKVAEIWKKAYEEYRKKYINLKPDEGNYKPSNSKPDFTDTASLIKNIVADYGQLIPIKQVWVTLQNDYEMIPYDMEFNGDTALYDIFKKIIDLYPRQTVYFDSNRTLCFEQRALAWNELSDNDTRFRAREFYDLVLEEQWSVSVDNIKNFTVVWGRDNTTYGYYYMTGYQAVCSKCGKKYNFSLERLQATNPNRTCFVCGGKLNRLHITNEIYSVQQIGTHKQVIYDDNVLTEEEAFNEAKWKTIASCRAGKTLTVTLVDRYLSMYQYSDKAIGKRIEYKSHLTNETDVYTLLKWTNNFSEGTVTMELEPYYTCKDEYVSFSNGKYSCMVLPEPTFNITVDENGLMTMIINNGWQTAYSLFKIYYRPTDDPVGEYDYWHTSMGMDFLGETCEVYTEETETECQTKVFHHQFEKSGRYMITCQAWNPNIHPSGCTTIKVIEVDLGTRYVSEDNKVYIDENNKEYIS